jgi:hypothetical protein
MKLTTNVTKDTEDESNTWDKKVFRDMENSEDCFNPIDTKAVEDFINGKEFKLDQVNLPLFSTEIIKEQTTYAEEINSEQKEDQID